MSLQKHWPVGRDIVGKGRVILFMQVNKRTLYLMNEVWHLNEVNFSEQI